MGKGLTERVLLGQRTIQDRSKAGGRLPQSERNPGGGEKKKPTIRKAKLREASRGIRASQLTRKKKDIKSAKKQESQNNN